MFHKSEHFSYNINEIARIMVNPERSDCLLNVSNSFWPIKYLQKYEFEADHTNFKF